MIGCRLPVLPGKRVESTGQSKIAPKSTEIFRIVKIFLVKYLFCFVNKYLIYHYMVKMS